MKEFEKLGLKEDVLKAIEKMGFEEPSEIQKEAIPILLEKKDMIGQAQTGTGKTLAFSAPMLSMIGKEKSKIKALILTPTRELAIQVNDEMNKIARCKDLKIIPVFGGSSIENQIRQIKSNTDIVVGTPGRVLDLIKRKVLKLESIEFLVLDEADEMLNMGFIDDIEKIIENSNSERQTLLFSATMPDRIKKLAKKYMKKELEHIKIEKKSITATNVSQFYFYTKPENRIETLYRVLDLYSPDCAIIFCNTKKEVDEISLKLQNRKYSAEGMHGDMTQNFRMRTLENFRKGNIEILVATDVAARGIDVSQVSHVINYGLPFETESYVHRIGRTGRANRRGEAFTILTPKEKGKLKEIKRELKCEIEKKPIPTITEIFEKKSEQIIIEICENAEKNQDEKFSEMARKLVENMDPIKIISSMLKEKYKKEVSYGVNKDKLEEASDRKERKSKSNKKSKNKDDKRIFINIGKKDGLNKKKLAELIKEKTNIKDRFINDIIIMDKFSFFYIDKRDFDKLKKGLNKKKYNNRRINIEEANDRN